MSFSEAATGLATFRLDLVVTFFELELLIMDFLLIAIVITSKALDFFGCYWKSGNGGRKTARAAKKYLAWTF